MTAMLIILAFILLALGLLCIVLQTGLGLPLMFGGTWVLAYATQYQAIGKITLIALAIVTLIGTVLDYAAGLLGAKYSGASKPALWGAFIGAIVGLFFGLFGIIFGSSIGAAVGEFWAKRDLLAAGKVSIATFIGFIIGVIAKISCALVILLTIAVVFIVRWF